MFTTPAYAQAAASPMEPFGGLLIPMILMLGIFYFFLIRPQSQRAKELRARVNAVRRGDTVITSGGMVGKVLKGDDLVAFKRERERIDELMKQQDSDTLKVASAKAEG